MHISEPLPDPETEPGARLPGEPAAAWAAFCAYRALGPRRSIRGAYRQRSGNEGATGNGQASGCWNAWARAYRWRERAEEWDRHVDREARLAHVDAVREMNRRQVELFQAVQAKALEALAKTTAEDLAPPDIVRWLVEATKGERLARGEVTEAVRNEQAGENKVTLEVVERIVRTRAEARDELPPATGGALPEGEGEPLGASGPPGGAAHDKAGPAGAMEPGKALLDFDLPDDPPAT